MMLRLLLIASILWTNQGFSQGMEFFHGTWEEVLVLAQKEDKVVFIDTYTSWCGPCKRMAKYTFTDEKVGKYYNKNFINYKLDMEKEEGMKFGLTYPVSAYPTLFFIKPNGDVLHKAKGGRQPDQFIDLGKTALAKYDNSSEYTKKYNDGDRSYEVVYKYIKALNKSGKSTIGVANEYLRDQEDVTTPDNLQLIFEAANEMDSRIYDMMIDNKSAIVQAVGQEDFEEKIRDAGQNTIEKAIEFKYEELVDEAIEKFSKELPSEKSTFGASAKRSYYEGVGDGKNYMKYTKAFVKKNVKNDSRKLNTVVSEMMKTFHEDKKVMKQAEKYAAKACNFGGEALYYFNYAQILSLNGKNDKALDTAKKGLDIAKESGKDEQKLKALIQHLQKKG